MPYKTVVPQKCKYYVNYITDNDLTDKLFDPSKSKKYTIPTYLYMYFLFQKSGLSFDCFYEIFNYASSVNPNDVPKRSALVEFKKKLSKLNIHEDIHNKYVNDLVTTDCLIDSVTVPNKNNSDLTGTYNYKGKKGVKVTHITNDIGFPIVASIDSGNDNDAKIGYKIIKDNVNILKDNNVTIITDKGYDSQNIRDYVYANGFSVIIPKNVRRTDNVKIKKIKQTEKENINNKRKQLMIKQKTLNKLKLKKLNEKKKIQKLKGHQNINKISINDLDKIINEFTCKIDEIKNERKQLPIQLKSNIKDKMEVLKRSDQKCNENMGFRKCSFCENETVCNECEKCKTCNKNLSYYKGLSCDEIKRYRKRIRVEHFISHYKNGRTSNVKDRRKNMLIDTVYNRYTDFLFIKNVIK
jgi:hypothetical protein